MADLSVADGARAGWRSFTSTGLAPLSLRVPDHQRRLLREEQTDMMRRLPCQESSPEDGSMDKLLSCEGSSELLDDPECIGRVDLGRVQSTSAFGRAKSLPNEGLLVAPAGSRNKSHNPGDLLRGSTSAALSY